jgi:protein-disulfide isomerase
MEKTNLLFAGVIILAVMLVASVLTDGYSSITGRYLNPEQAAQKAIEFVNNNLVAPGTTVTFVSVDEFNDLYKVAFLYQDQQGNVYVTRDGSHLFISEPLDIQGQLPTELPPQQPTQVEVSLDDDPQKGSSSAEITIVEFSDFECPFCGKFVSETLPQIEEQYVDTGKVKLVYRDFPLSFHENAQKTAEAAECADDQGKFWEYHDIIFENQNSLGTSDLEQYAADLGLNTEEFNSCLSSNKHSDEVLKDSQDGQNYGVTGTPTFFILDENGDVVEKIVGAQPFSVFQEIIDSM